MGLVYATKDATPSELLLFQLLMSIYRDGSGAEREGDGTTRANWRQIERCVADLVNSTTNEDKNIFDVSAPDSTDSSTYYGYSVKSKQLSKTKFKKLSSVGRVYMEIANSPVKFWDEVNLQHGLTEADFRSKNDPSKIGSAVINLVKKWHIEGKEELERLMPGVTLDLNASNYFCLSYSKDSNSSDREYQIHIFSLDYPANIKWEYSSKKCLRGYDPAYPTEPLIDWYGLSGGQLKYYPRATSARYASPIFKLLTPPRMSATDKAKIYFPDQLK